MIIYVVTFNTPSESEIYITAKPTFREAERFVLNKCPDARKRSNVANLDDTKGHNRTEYSCGDSAGSYAIWEINITKKGR